MIMNHTFQVAPLTFLTPILGEGAGLMQPVDDDGKGSITGYVAGCAERVHRNVEGDDERLSFRIEAKHAGQWS